jgi:CRISPR/Cas system-associated protein Cas7 (RAMP superfamily)
LTYDPFDPFNEVPMYTDYFLKFADETEAYAALFTEQTNVQDDVVETVLVPKYAAIDVVGVLYAPTGKTIHNEELSYAEMAPVPGFHANVRHTAEAPELAAYQVFPETPSRTWA